ncbi:Katanin p80 WD40 repeat-containing subunit B1 like [Apostasia shenzhenica]|uniref:Katanin p80 WD40 repeat-containing subunit B1 like n=1 Tax=Apostasia shenzhenica TaxID=1088818 RepID=A0A2I0B621_9ASPA|nr:Katanin p80 WD40 repeat-containing subunit B1 like [Apostasia shenzhenica]
MCCALIGFAPCTGALKNISYSTTTAIYFLLFLVCLSKLIAQLSASSGDRRGADELMGPEEHRHFLEEGEVATTVVEDEEKSKPSDDSSLSSRETKAGEPTREEKSNPVNGAAADGLSDTFPWPKFRFDIHPRLIYHFAYQFRGGSNRNNFLKGIKWSPDGSSFLISSDDNSFRLFYLPEDDHQYPGKYEECPINQDSYSSALLLNEAEMVYDYCWYPYMSLLDPTTCVFASTTRDHPIHLWDSISGELRGTYRAYDAMDEITAALSVSFNTSGSKIFAGYDKYIRVFDIHRPGREFEQFSLTKAETSLAGIISAIAFSPTYSGMLAVGSYSQTTSVYMEGNMELLYVLHGQIGGVTQVLFSKDGNYIYTGGRKDPYILCWDIRNTIGIVYKLYRASEYTNQRISFDIDSSGRHLGTGGQDGLVHIYDLQSGEWVTGFQAASDTVNCLSFHPTMPMAASSSGHRRFALPDNFDKNINLSGDENCASIWNFSSPMDLEDNSSQIR